MDSYDYSRSVPGIGFVEAGIMEALEKAESERDGDSEDVDDEDHFMEVDGE